MKPLVSTPHSETVAKQPHWNFPQTIEPDSEEAARDFGVVYNLIAFILINMKATHFTAWYASDWTQVYTYDSMRNNGYPVYDEDMKFETNVMGKKPTLPKGFVIWQAIYHLHGEIAAQDKFYEIWMKEYATQYHLYFSEQNLDKLPTMSYHHAGFHEMEKKKHTWMFQPEHSGTTEYLMTTIPSLAIAQEGPESKEETTPPVLNLLSSTLFQDTQSPPRNPSQTQNLHSIVTVVQQQMQM